jgi:hypothetical protein
MSITDITAGRMPPARAFGQRRIPPAPVRPHREPLPSPLRLAARGYGRVLSDRIPAILQRARQSASALPAILRLALQSAAAWLQTLRLARKSLDLSFLPPPLFASVRPAGRAFLRAALSFLRRYAPPFWQALARKAWRALIRALAPNAERARKAAIRALLRSEASTTFVRLLAYLGAVALLTVAADHALRLAPRLVEGEAPPAVEWLDVAKPFPAFSLPMSELTEVTADYAMRRHLAGGGRADILTFGELKSRAPHLMVEIYRPGSERGAFDKPEAEIAARLAGLDVVSFKRAGEMTTKFGRAVLVEFSLREPNRQCLGFVRAYNDPSLQILGWQCSRGSAPPERALAACALDRLTLIGGSDPKLRALFARAEMRRTFCGQRSHLMTPTPKLGPSAPPPEIRRRRLAAQ